jgi:hypothetical protein
LTNILDDISYKASENRSHKKALVVAGASLVVIEKYDYLKEAFLSTSDKVDVLLACRVTPK